MQLNVKSCNVLAANDCYGLVFFFLDGIRG